MCNGNKKQQWQHNGNELQPKSWAVVVIYDRCLPQLFGKFGK